MCWIWVWFVFELIMFSVLVNIVLVCLELVGCVLVVIMDDVVSGYRIVVWIFIELVSW